MNWDIISESTISGSGNWDFSRMFALLSDMFKRGHPADIAFFVVGGWLLGLFLAMMAVQAVRRWRCRGRGRRKPD